MTKSLLDRKHPFLYIKNNIECPFSSSSNLKVLPPVNNLDSNMIRDNLVADIIDYSSNLSPSLDDGLVVTFTDARCGNSLENLSKTLRNLLFAIGRFDYDCQNSLSQDLLSDGWKLIICGNRFFCLTMGPLYESNHSRYNGGTLDTYIIFQTQYSFQRRWPPGQNKIPNNVRCSIRETFKAAFKPYDPEISTGPIEAFRFVKPLKLGDPCVRWWEE